MSSGQPYLVDYFIQYFEQPGPAVILLVSSKLFFTHLQWTNCQGRQLKVTFLQSSVCYICGVWYIFSINKYSRTFFYFQLYQWNIKFWILLFVCLSIYSPFTRVDSFVFKTFGYFNWWLMHWRTIVCFNLSRLHLAQMQSFSFVKNFLIQQSVHWKLKYSIHVQRFQ